MSIGSRLKEARLRHRMTQAELARAVEVTTSAIGNYETGVSIPKEPVLIALMKALGVDANYLYQDYGVAAVEVIAFAGDPAAEFTSSEEYALLTAWRQADERARQDALVLLKQHGRQC